VIFVWPTRIGAVTCHWQSTSVAAADSAWRRLRSIQMVIDTATSTHYLGSSPQLRHGCFSFLTSERTINRYQELRVSTPPAYRHAALRRELERLFPCEGRHSQ
jgi:hypothetical protein